MSYPQTLWDEVNYANFEHPRISELAAADRCYKCKSAIWTLYCRTGFLTRLRVAPVTPAEDLAFYLAKRHTYKLWRSRGKFEIELRLPHDLTKVTDDIALAVHRCDDEFAHDWPDYWPTASRPFIPLNEEPPF